MATRGPEDSALISNHVQLCFVGFAKFCLSLAKADTATKHKVAPFNVNDEIGKFRLWCGNIAAHRRGRSSLDYKLREASHIRDRVLDLLRNLESIIREANEIVSGERVPWEDMSDSDSDYSDNDLVHKDAGTTELQQLISNMADIVTCLMRLSMAIRNPAPHDQFKESVHIDTSHFEVSDIEHVRGKFPNAEEHLVIRLGKAISRRRQYLRYRDEHRKKLEQGLQFPIPEATPGIIVVPIVIAPSEIIQSTAASSIHFAIKAGSSAAGLDDQDYYEDTLSQTSYASSASDTTRLRPPPLPEQGQDGDPFECPLCFRLTSVRTVSAWHKHVYRDLHPYVCTWDDCITPDITYESRHDWFSHEVHAHRTFWECIDGCNISFHSHSDFRRHLQLAHTDWSSEDRLDDMMRSCERTSNMDAEAECVLCQQKYPSLTQLRRHLGKHHEELALFALPLYMKDEQEESDDDQENNGSHSLHSSVGGDSQLGSSEMLISPVQSHEHGFKLIVSHPSYANLNCSTCSETIISNYLECQGCETRACESCSLKEGFELAGKLGQIKTYNKTFKDSSDGSLKSSGQESQSSFAVVDDRVQETSSIVEAKQLQVEAIETRKNKLGLDHPDTLKIMNQLAWTYQNQGRWKEAEQLQVEVMETRMNKLGLDHPDTLDIMANLAWTYQKQAQWEEAETLQVEVMETRMNKLGLDHPDTLYSMASLAWTYQKQGRWKEAEKLQVEVMETRKNKLELNHLDTLDSMENLAWTYQKQGRLEEAEQLRVEVMESRKKKLGIDHPDTLNSMANLASTYYKQGRWEEAEKLQVEAMETRKKKLGIDHPDTLDIMANLAWTYYKQAQLEEAETLQVEVMETRMNKLGLDHPDTLDSMANLAWTYQKQAQWEEAETLQVEVMETRKNKLGLNHPDTLEIMNQLAWTYQNQGRWKEAAQLEVK
jgi:tetratricopeptide (TPR) repeat protein